MDTYPLTHLLTQNVLQSEQKYNLPFTSLQSSPSNFLSHYLPLLKRVMSGKVNSKKLPSRQANKQQSILLYPFRFLMCRVNSHFHVALAALYFIHGPSARSKDQTWSPFLCLLSKQSTYISRKKKVHLLAKCSLNSHKEMKYFFQIIVIFSET